MTATAIAAPTAPAVPASRRRRTAARRRRADGLLALAWASAAVALGLYPASGTVDLSTPGAVLTALGIGTGLVGTDLVLVMLVLAARIPAVDRIIGHDQAMAAHKRIGKPAFYLLLAHGALLTLGYAVADGIDVVAETAALLTVPDLTLAYVALGPFTAVVVSSLVAVRRRMAYEVWHVIHLLSYAAVLTALPHQLSQGALLAEGTAQRVYWIGLYVVALGSIVVFRMLRPLAQSARHAIRVAEVERIAPDAVSIHLTGRGLRRLGARGGQFFSWRFWAAGAWWHAHPLSLSAVPDDRHARITVRALGRGSAGLAELPEGTPVTFSGPFGLFTDLTRRHDRVAIAAAGIGVTPVRALVEELGAAETTVLVRAGSVDELYLWDELAAWGATRGVAVYRSVGPRASGPERWLSADDAARGVRMESVFPRLVGSDLYLCGPDGWADAVETRARGLGVPADDIHRERFDW